MKPHNELVILQTEEAVVPGWKWRWTRRLTQTIGLLALLAGPLLGGWIRLDEKELAAWHNSGSDLPAAVATTLPRGQWAELAEGAHQLLGGGIASEFFSIPLMDPVTGTLALIHAPGSRRALVAVILPVLIALVAGRVFCGWLCPFGVVARFLDRLLDLFPWRPRYRLPHRRPLRWVVLGIALLASFLGIHLLLYISLPYLLLQQASYAVWLLGGGSAVLAVLLGLLVAGLLLGPTSYCAALCPTGAVLSLLGRKRPLHLTIAAPSACGSHCHLCDEACWLHLDPASGDPGPDCDLCMRCVSACPRSNMRFTLLKKRRATATLLLLTLMCGILTLFATPADAKAPRRKPRLLLEQEQLHGAVTAALSVVDLSGVALDADARQKLAGIEVSLFLARGERGAPDKRGVLPGRDVYSGPVMLQLHHAKTGNGEAIHFQAPTSPISTVKRTIYRRRLTMQLAPGDTMTLAPIPGWIDQPVTWVIPPGDATDSSWLRFQFFGAAVLVFLGLLSLAFTFSTGPAR